MGFELVTPELAREYLTTMHTNRNLSRLDVGVLTENLEQDQWFAEISPVYFDSENRAWDGMHRFRTITATGKPAYLLFVRGVSAEAAEFADTGRRRMYIDNLKRRGNITDFKRQGVLAKWVALYDKYGIEGIRTPQKFALTQMDKDKWVEHPNLLASIHLGQQMSRHLGAQESWAAYAVWATGEGQDPDGFWGKVVSGENLVKGDPAKTLREWYMKGRERERTPVDQRVMFMYATATAWNKHVLGQSWSSVSPRFDVKQVASRTVKTFPSSNIPEFLPLDPGLREKHLEQLRATAPRARLVSA